MIRFLVLISLSFFLNWSSTEFFAAYYQHGEPVECCEDMDAHHDCCDEGDEQHHDCDNDCEHACHCSSASNSVEFQADALSLKSFFPYTPQKYPKIFITLTSGYSDIWEPPKI